MTTHPDPAVRALVERAKAEGAREALLAAADELPYVGVAGANWLRARADSLAAQPAPEGGRLRVEVQANGARPATCQVWRDNVMIFDGIARTALLSKPAPEAATEAVVHLDAETRIPVGVSTPCPATTTAHLGFKGLSGVRVPCGDLTGHDGPHVFHVEWSEETP